MENWKEIANTDGQYLISDEGRVLSVGNSKTRKDKIMKTYSYSKTGHMKVDLRIAGEIKKKQIHRLVAEAFIENPENLPFVNHKDNDPTNNRMENLEWCTPRQNQVHYYRNLHEYKNPPFCNINQKAEILSDRLINDLCNRLKLSREQLKEIL